MLRLRTLGDLELYLSGQRIDDRLPAKAVAMAVYLADQGGRARRTTLAGLLWSEQPEDRARANLRVALSRLRSEASDLVQSDREWVSLAEPFDLDASRLLDADVDELGGLYQGDFLHDFELPGADLFGEWVATRRADLRATAMRRLSDEAANAKIVADWVRCERLAQAMITIDRWNERAHRLAVEALGAHWGRSAAMSHLERYTSDLARELGAEPDPAIVAIAESTREAAHPAAGERFHLPEQAEPPSWPTPLIGRTQELERLATLAQPGRPVAIVGPGGIGKSRLLARFARTCRADGGTPAYVSFDGHAPTQACDTARVFAETVLVTLGIPADGELGPMESLARHLGSSQLILCLDNLEQLSEIERPLADLQHACRELTMVITSRRLPALMNARVFRLEGLSTEASPESPAPAVELFLDRLGRADVDLDTRGAIADVCRALEGHPLAIELAAQWVETSPLDDLVGFIDSVGSDTSLGSCAPDIAERHRSLDVLVGASVDQLHTGSQRALQASAMFAGPFDEEDVRALLGDGTCDLAELVSHSLLTVDGTKYQMHPVVRRYERQRLRSQGNEGELRRRHAQRMVDVMQAIENPLSSGLKSQRRAVDMRTAIDWMIDHAPAEEIPEPLTTYLGFQRSWGWFESSRSTISRALERSDLTPVIRAELHRHCAEAFLHAGLHDEASAALEQGIDLVGQRIPESAWGRRWWNVSQIAALIASPVRAASVEDRVKAAERARLMTLLGETFYVSDRRREIVSYGLGSLSAGRLSRDPTLRAAGDAAVSIASQLAGAHAISEYYRRRARRRSGRGESNPFTAAEVWGITAVVAVGAGEWDDARRDCAIAIEAASRAGRTRMISQLEILTALVDYHEQDLDAGLRRLQSVEASIEQTGFRRALTWIHATTAEIALVQNECALADIAASRALDTARSWGRPEDEARARIARARVSLLRSDERSAAQDIQMALTGLRSPSALGVQHFELHCGAAECATELLSSPSLTSVPIANQTTSSLRKYAQAFPIARPRLRRVQESQAG